MLVKPYTQLNSLKIKFSSLNKQEQELAQKLAHNHAIEEDIKNWQLKNKDILPYLKSPVRLENLYKKISGSAQANHLQMINLKPKSFQKISTLNQKIIEVELSGQEINLINFLHFLVRQKALIELKNIEFKLIKNGVYLKATLAAYFCE